MPSRKQPRSIARELALLSISQIKIEDKDGESEDLGSLVLEAVRTLVAEIQDNLEAAAAEVRRGEERLLNSQTRSTNLDSSRAMIAEALELAQNAINRLGIAAELPEFVQLTHKEQVREYAIEIVATVRRNRQTIEQTIEQALVAWQLSRLAKIDRDILRISVAEMLYLEIPEKVAINEAVELAKRYSDDDGFRFINGVLRRVSDRLKQQATPQS
jgi:transcription antitermination protein NusB